ncbi:MAG: hypothetical protein HS126_37165 [Anaerolineales bacterium]|nr:hypothetical protein [Anaerolineales bacterium]
MENVEGYAVWTGQKDTGLTLVPEVKLEASGQAQVNKSRWFVNYDRAGKPVAGPYRSVSEARGWPHSGPLRLDQGRKLRG